MNPSVESVGKYLTAALLARPRDKKTEMWAITEENGGEIAHVKWHSPWRRYVLEIHGNTIFEQDCLRALAEFLERKTREHKVAAAATRLGFGWKSE